MAKRRTFGNTWWGKQWLDALSYVDYDNRLPRGRTYYNTGHVESCEWIAHEQSIEAFVSGSAYYPYEISIALPKWGEEKERQLLDAIAQDPALVAELLEGTLSPAVADICRELHLDLFPKSWREMRTSCSCPDSARICKHIAAVFYCLADQIDANPFLIFKLHGLDLQSELKNRGVDLKSATTARPLFLSELASTATESKPDPISLDETVSLTQLRSLPYGTLEPLRETILSLFPKSLPLPGDETFRDDIRKLLTGTEQQLKRIPPTTDASDWLSSYLAPQLYRKRIAVDDSSLPSLSLAIQARADNNAGFETKLVVRIRDTDGKDHKINLSDPAVVFELLLTMPVGIAQEASPEVECWREISKLAARLLLNSAIVPALVVPKNNPKAVPFFLWTPAVRNRRVAQLVEQLTQACKPYATHLFEDCALEEKAGVVRQTVFLAITSALCALVRFCADKITALSKTGSLTMLLAMQTPLPSRNEIPETLLKGMLRGLRPFLLGNSYPWRPVLTVRTHSDGIKINYGILGREVDPAQIEVLESVEDSLFDEETSSRTTTLSTKRPVMLKRLLKEDRFKDERFAAVSVLKTLTSAYPALSRIEETNGSPVTLERNELKKFLFDAAPVLTLLGVAVMLPERLKNLLKPRLVAHMDAGTGKSFLGKDAFSRFDWRVAVGDREITQQELEELVKHAGEIVQLGDDFVYLEPNELARLAETVDKQPQPTYLEKMRAALMGDYEKNGQQAEVFVSAEIRQRLKTLTEVTDIAPPENLNATLRPYQARGFAWLMKNLRLGIGALIADDMGLGKTLQVIATLLQLKNDGELSKTKALVVVPTTLMTNWQREIAKFAPELSVGVYHGSNRVLPEAVKDLPDVTLTTYGLMRRETEKLAGYKWRLLVLDEAQAVKNAASGQSVAAKSIKATQTIAMTGTPVENRLSEYWSILETVQPRLLGSLKDFTETFATPIETDHSEAVAEAFRRLTAPFMLRRLKSDKSIIADLPERNTIDQFTNLTAEQAALYSKVLEEHMAKLKKLDAKAAADPTGNDAKTARRGQVLRLITSMKQICNSPSQYLKTEAATPDSGKAAALFDILGRCREASRKVLIFTQYREMGERLQTWIEKATGERPDFLHGGVSVKARQDMVDRFQTDRSVHSMIISLKAGGTGLNLTAASCVVHYDLWWNPAVEAQATDRAYRIGQRRDVLVYRFVTAGTFEERINEMLTEKQSLADLTVTTGETWIGDLSSSELQSLFSLDPKSVTG